VDYAARELAEALSQDVERHRMVADVEAVRCPMKSEVDPSQSFESSDRTAASRGSCRTL
jgi:hypothetical protein